MERDKLIPYIVESADGSHTLRVDGLKEHYHSHKGAITESEHVFLQMGLEPLASRSSLRILEVGFGTGLNALLTALRSNNEIVYTGLEPFPLDWDLINQLNYPNHVPEEQAADLFSDIHKAEWDVPVSIQERFTLVKRKQSLEEHLPLAKYDLIYYDAFAPHAQPELWSSEVWAKLYDSLESPGVLVTYCAKGQVRRDMQAVGFEVERLQGPPGKREMLRASKP